MGIDDRKINLLRTMASGFSACGRTTGHGESCTSGWLCDACEKRKEISDGVMEICADIVQLNAELECARGDLSKSYGLIYAVSESVDIDEFDSELNAEVIEFLSRIKERS